MRVRAHMRVRKVVVVGSHGQRDDHGSDRGDYDRRDHKDHLLLPHPTKLKSPPSTKPTLANLP